ncbi:hypothetical protein [Methylobacterium sp. MA0201]|uniref:hypothetical protein n=1 Tax=Methylobacterium alsaeris TaxID=3344826 RepID=UPI003756E3D9
MPLSQTTVSSYCQPWSSSAGWLFAQPISLFQNQSVVKGSACRAQAAACGA